MASNAYTPTHRQWDHVGNLVPNWEHSEGIRPAMYGAPAPWLPVLWQDKYYEVWVVVSPGKGVALTADEFLVPAGLRVSWAAAADGDTILTYTSDDVNEKVVDLTTGEALAATASYTKAQVRTALRSRGLIGAAAAIETYISKPVGLASQAYYSWASTTKDGFKPADLKFHNFRMQHQVQVLCDYVVRVPWLASAETDSTIDATLTAGTPVFGDANLRSAADTKTLVRYSALTGSDFIAWFAADMPIARDSERTPITADNDSILVRLRSGPDQLTAAGDYFIDHEVGVFFFYVAGGASVPAYVNGAVLTYNAYSAVPTSVGDYISATGALKPGSFVEMDADSNFTVSTSTSIQDVMGQVVAFIKHPRDLLDRVKSRYETLGTVNKMPGTATRGVPDNLNVSVTGSDTEVVINLISR